MSVEEQRLFSCKTNEELENDRLVSSYGIRPPGDGESVNNRVSIYLSDCGL